MEGGLHRHQVTRQRRFAPFTMADLGDHDAAISAFTMAGMRTRHARTPEARHGALHVGGLGIALP